MRSPRRSLEGLQRHVDRVLDDGRPRDVDPARAQRPREGLQFLQLIRVESYAHEQESRRGLLVFFHAHVIHTCINGVKRYDGHMSTARTYGRSPRGLVAAPAPRHLEWYDRHLRGETQRSIAASAGVSVSTVERAVRRVDEYQQEQRWARG